MEFMMSTILDNRATATESLAAERLRHDGGHARLIHLVRHA